MTTSYSTFEGVHPCIDVSSLLQAGKQHPSRSKTVLQIGDALKERGYFYAQNVSILSTGYLEYICEYSQCLHALPLKIRREFLHANGGFVGYSGADVGLAELAYNPGTTIALVHAWDYSWTRLEADKGKTYPDATVIDPPYEQVLDELYKCQNVLARRALMEVFAECLGLPDVFVEPRWKATIRILMMRKEILESFNYCIIPLYMESELVAPMPMLVSVLTQI